MDCGMSSTNTPTRLIRFGTIALPVLFGFAAFFKRSGLKSGIMPACDDIICTKRLLAV